MDISGHARVLLYAKKKIYKGEYLYYDYNAGGFDDYPTENFIWKKRKCCMILIVDVLIFYR